MTKREKRIQECINDKCNDYVCFSCAKQHRTKRLTQEVFTIHQGTCYICQEIKPVSSARKLFAHYKSI